MLRLCLLLTLKVLKGKQQDMIVRGIANLEHLNVDPLFPSTPSDNPFKRIEEPRTPC
jgi:hypothetical protein